MAKKEEDRSTWLVPDMPADAAVEVAGKGLFVNSTGKPFEAPVEAASGDTAEGSEG